MRHKPFSHLRLGVLIAALISGATLAPAQPKAQEETALIPPDPLSAAAEGGSVDAQFALGETYENDEIPAHRAEAAKWYLRAAEHGNERAQCALGVMYILGLPELTRPYAMTPPRKEWIDRYLETEKIAPAKAEAAAIWLQKSAEKGYPEAEYCLGVMCAKGIGVAKNPVETERWFGQLRAAANSGHAEAMFYLGSLYSNKEVVPPAGDGAAEGALWIRKAAEQNLPKAEFALAKKYQFRDGVAPDQAEAIRWMHRAAEQGVAGAQLYLGSWYKHGIKDLAQNIPESIKWTRKAAEQGCGDAQVMLFYYYSDGRYIKKDPVEAEKWRRQAVERGLDTAPFSGEWLTRPRP